MDQHLNPDISATDLRGMLQKGEDLHLIDVREKIEYHTYNIGGRNIPLGDLEPFLRSSGFKQEDRIVVICQHGIRSETARRLFISAGYKNVKNLAGGLLAYRRTEY